MSSVSPSQTLPPPPPSPPPSFVFSQFFSKRGGSKNRRIHSLLTSTTSTPSPPPPPPLPSSRYSRMQQESVAPILSPSLPSRTRRSNRQVPQPLPLLPPSPSRARLNKKNEKSNLTRFSMSPLFTLRIPPPMSEWDIRLRIPADETGANGGESNGVEAGGSTVGQAEATLGVTEFCPSPDVNNKADLFIARFCTGLKLEKMNSLREKERRTVQQPLPPEEEFLVVGSLFDDDGPVPT